MWGSWSAYGNSARTDLCGGWQVTAIPTATDVAGSGQRLKVESRKNRRDRFRLLLLTLDFSYPVAKIIIRI